jgi:hypothetical protein
MKKNKIEPKVNKQAFIDIQNEITESFKEDIEEL